MASTLRVNHSYCYRWGTARIHWTGTQKELDELFAWIDKYIPAKYRHEDEIVEPNGHGRTNRSMAFEISAWTFLCQWWTTGHFPSIGTTFNLKVGHPQF